MTAAPAYRRAGLEDRAAIMQVRLSVRENILHDPSRITEAEFHAYFDAVGRGWVAEIDGRIIGFSFANRSGLIWALFLTPGFEGGGIGRALLALCLDWLRAQGVAQAFLDTGAGTRAENFYRRQGWRETARDRDSIAFVLDLFPPRRCASLPGQGAQQ